MSTGGFFCDATGWRPEAARPTATGILFPTLYGTNDFERTVVLKERTEQMAAYIRNFMAEDRFAKTLVFALIKSMHH